MSCELLWLLFLVVSLQIRGGGGMYPKLCAPAVQPFIKRYAHILGEATQHSMESVNKRAVQSCIVSYMFRSEKSIDAH